MIRRLASIAVAAAMLAALFAAAAFATSRDSNHDRIPDRWERVHHLSLKVDQSRRDQDRDGLRNLAEFRHHSDPRDADSDDDGIRDGRDDAPNHDAGDDHGDDGAGHDVGDDHGGDN